MAQGAVSESSDFKPIRELEVVAQKYFQFLLSLSLFLSFSYSTVYLPSLSISISFSLVQVI